MENSLGSHRLLLTEKAEQSVDALESAQDETVVAHTKRGRPLTFKHPAVQSCLMFAGEFGCLIIYIIITCTKSKKPADTSTVQSEASGSVMPAPPRRGLLPSL